MSFADSDKKESNFRRTEFMDLSEGTHTIRVLEPKATRKYTHFLNKAYVECLEDSCPICKTNQSLQLEYPETYREEKHYSARTKRYYVNVLDRTIGVVCPDCKTEYKLSIPTTCQCGRSLTDLTPAPLNSVKVLAGGVTLFEDHLNALDLAIVSPETHEPYGLMAFDVSLVVKGKGKERSITPIPMPISDLGIDLTTLELFDLERALIKLQPDEMLDVQRGTSLKDIFSARNANKNADTVVTETRTAVSESVMTDINDRVANLFKNG